MIKKTKTKPKPKHKMSRNTEKVNHNIPKKAEICFHE